MLKDHCLSQHAKKIKIVSLSEKYKKIPSVISNNFIKIKNANIDEVN